MPLTTYLTQEDIDLCVNFSVQEIRSFYSFLMNSNQNSSYAQGMNGFLLSDHEALKNIVHSFSADETQLLSERLISNGSDSNAHIFPVRIEVRTDKAVTGASQIAVRGVYQNFRTITLEHFHADKNISKRALSIKTSGQMSFEINVAGVDKALPFYYLNENLKTVLDAMGYKPGAVINAYNEEMIIAADADGTTYGFPTISALPTLKESLVYQSLVDFLKLGGVYMVVSGNKIERTLARIVESIPVELRSNVIVVANGAADMAWLGADGRFISSVHYRENALQTLKHENQINELNVVYIGDDGRIDGNDFPAYACVGVDKSILVCDKKAADIKLKHQTIGGHEAGTRKVLDKINRDLVKQNQTFPLTAAYVNEIIADVS